MCGIPLRRASVPRDLHPATHDMVAGPSIVLGGIAKGAIFPASPDTKRFYLLKHSRPSSTPAGVFRLQADRRHRWQVAHKECGYDPGRRAGALKWGSPRSAP